VDQIDRFDPAHEPHQKKMVVKEQRIERSGGLTSMGLLRKAEIIRKSLGPGLHRTEMRSLEVVDSAVSGRHAL
jgi:hypothetical protein